MAGFNDRFGDKSCNAAMGMLQKRGFSALAKAAAAKGGFVPHLGRCCKLQRMTGPGSGDRCPGSIVARPGCGPTC